MSPIHSPLLPSSLSELKQSVESGIDIALPLADSLMFRQVDRPAQGFFAKQVRRRFANLVGGQVDIFDETGNFSLAGSRETPDEYEADPLSARVFVSDSEMYRRIMLGGTIGAAESYMARQWSTDNLTALIRIMIRNLDHFSQLEKGWARLKNAWHFVQHLFRHNSVENSKRNIHEHYDLGNDFYRLFLDETMNYSSGLFQKDDLSGATSSAKATMQQGSLQKMDSICRKLQINSLDHVLEIGTGWGAMAIFMAQNYGCRVTTTTISQEQYRLAQQRVEAAGLEDRVTVLLEDYRNLEGQYDKIVSIEMIEAVGHQYYDQYFKKCNSLLRNDGAMLLQAITIGEQNYEYHIRHVDFIGKYIFPGGSLPSVSALTQSVGRVSRMRMLYQEDLTPHYQRTIELWRIEFMRRLNDVRSQGFSESFIRRWHFYLCYCEAAFAERRVHCTHVMFAKPACKLDPYIQFNDAKTGLRRPEIEVSN
ncbi:MAG: cyclopropane-fatty-acyl-phospholipid synthase family protein [Planctomycetota bacterium]